MPHFIQNTDKSYSCTQCGNADGNSIIREDPSGQNPRLRCGSCKFMFNAVDSVAASEAGAIKASSLESLAAASEPEVDTLEPRVSKVKQASSNPTIWDKAESQVLPKFPAYLFVTKDRKTHTVCSKKDFKATAIKWSDRPHDCYELTKLNLSVKVEVGGS